MVERAQRGAEQSRGENALGTKSLSCFRADPQVARYVSTQRHVAVTNSPHRSSLCLIRGSHDCACRWPAAPCRVDSLRSTWRTLRKCARSARLDSLFDVFFSAPTGCSFCLSIFLLLILCCPPCRATAVLCLGVSCVPSACEWLCNW